jgi:hypothetical protein
VISSSISEALARGLSEIADFRLPNADLFEQPVARAIGNHQLAIGNVYGGKGGIRTHGALPHTAFPVLPVKPLLHLSGNQGQRKKSKGKNLFSTFLPFTFLLLPLQGWRRGWDSNPRWP